VTRARGWLDRFLHDGATPAAARADAGRDGTSVAMIALVIGGNDDLLRCTR
jgi:hypothetical protein